MIILKILILFCSLWLFLFCFSFLTAFFYFRFFKKIKPIKDEKRKYKQHSFARRILFFSSFFISSGDKLQPFSLQHLPLQRAHSFPGLYPSILSPFLLRSVFKTDTGSLRVPSAISCTAYMPDRIRLRDSRNALNDPYISNDKAHV